MRVHLSDARPGGHEASIELRTAAYAACYLSYWHRPQAPINSPHCSPVVLTDLVEAQQRIRSGVCSQAGSNPPKQRLTTGWEKSASICSSKLKYLIIDEFLYSGCVPVPEASSKQRTVRPRRAASFERGIRGEEIAADGSSTDRGFRPRRRITDTLGILRDPPGPVRAIPAPWHTLVPGCGCEPPAYRRCS